MAPSKNSRRGRPLRPTPVTTRSRAAANRAARPTLSRVHRRTELGGRSGLPEGRSSGIWRSRGWERYEGGALFEPGVPD